MLVRDTVISLQVLQEKLHSRLERALLSSLDLGFGQVSTDGETVLAACKVLPLIQFRALGTSPEDGIRFSLGFDREPHVRLTRVDQEGNARLFERLSRRI